MKKISALTWIVCGLALGILAAAYGFTQHYQPKTQHAADINAYADSLSAEAAKLNASAKKLERAHEMVREKEAEWNEIVQVKTPPENTVNLGVTPFQLTVESKKFHNKLQAAVNQQVKAGGVEVVQGPTVPVPTEDPNSIMASYYNYPAIGYPVVIFELGTVTVKGSYSQITENARSWKYMPNYLAVSGGLQISGTEPTLTGTYSLVLLGYLRGRDLPTRLQAAVAAPAAATSTAPRSAVPLGAITGPGG
jgi:hypothetical protein